MEEEILSTDLQEPMMFHVPSNVDSDIQSSVRKNLTNMAADNPLRYLLEAQRTTLLSWLCRQIQNERDGWKHRLELALKESDRYRKTALLNDGLVQTIREKMLRVLRQAGCDMEDDRDVTTEDIVSKTCDICSFLIEDQSRCYAMIVPRRNIENRTLAEILSHKLDQSATEIASLKLQLTELKERKVTKCENSVDTGTEPLETETKTVEPEPEIHEPETELKLPVPRVLTKEKSTLVKNTLFTFDKMSLKMLVDSHRDGPMFRAKRFHEMESRIESLQDKVKILELESDRKGREIMKFKSNIRMLKRMYHYDNNALNNSISISKRKEQAQIENNVNGLSVVKQGSKEVEMSSTSPADDTTPPFSNARTSVSRCLRCQRLYRLQDNHKMACHFHPKARKKFEKYTSSGRLINVIFIWDCCKKDGDNEGCCTDQHI